MLFTLLDTIPVYFRIDAVGRLFVTVVSLIWLMSAAMFNVPPAAKVRVSL